MHDNIIIPNGVRIQKVDVAWSNLIVTFKIFIFFYDLNLENDTTPMPK